MVLVFDVGATHSRISLAEGGKLISPRQFETKPETEGFETLLGHIQEVAEGHDITAVAGGVAAQFDAQGSLTLVTNISGWEQAPLGQEIERRLGVKPLLRNDIVMCGVGEAHHGAGASQGITAYLTISTGVNGVRLVDGFPDPSIERFELGYQIVSGGPGHPASLESLVGGKSLKARLGRSPADIEDPAFWQQTAGYIGRAIYNMELYWGTGAVVLGGSMMRDIPLAGIQAAIDALPQVLGRPTQLHSALLGDQAGLMGAVTYLEKSA
jgi:predicted NBD/HSP70 family sugar kinase